jgi:hypothetical protein
MFVFLSCTAFYSLMVFEFVLFGVFVYPLLFSSLFPSLGVCLHYMTQLHHCSDLVLGSTCNCFEGTIVEME